MTDRELFVIIKSLQHFKHYLIGKEFVLCTDHKALDNSGKFGTQAAGCSDDPSYFRSFHSWQF
ncbi:hypothetical protein PAEPH01_2273 [Pancytospora epiphaga]|nr:hypothetical protein PAEPH01_2273 [Pancytospora epiphaga]